MPRPSPSLNLNLIYRSIFEKYSFFSPILYGVEFFPYIWKIGVRKEKTALGCKSSILAIHDRSGPVEQRPFFKAALPSPNIEKCDQNSTEWVRVL